MEATEKQKEARAFAEAQRDLLKLRLLDEGENDLHAKIAPCGNIVYLRCACCSDPIELSNSCKRKWCPSCVRRSAARRSAELGHIVRHFRHPLFVTLTMRNVSDLSLGGVRGLRRAFGKLRHRKLWKRRVTAGVAAIEVTNEGNGWHPHLHTALDCLWLADKTPPPQFGQTPTTHPEIFKAAAQEMESAWSKCLKQETSSIRIKRCDAATISKEVLKYSVKGSDLLQCQEPIGDLIRALDGTRLLTTFGKAHGSTVRDIRKEAKAKLTLEEQAFRDELPPRCACGSEEWMPADLIQRWAEKRVYEPTALAIGARAKYKPGEPGHVSNSRPASLRSAASQLAQVGRETE